MSKLLLIPLNPSGSALFDVDTTLDGATHSFRFHWNEREDRWYVDWIGFAIGRKIIPGWKIFRRARSRAGHPDGALVFANNAPDFRPPGFAELGTRTVMLFVPGAS